MVEDTWIGLTSEPRNVDYIEVDTGGRTALSAIPKDSPKSQVLFAVHGGGFISGCAIDQGLRCGTQPPRDLL